MGHDPEEDPRKRHGASYVLLTLAVIAALVLVGLAGKALMGNGTPVAQTTAVPNVVDMTRDDAIAKLKAAGFSPVVSTRTDTSAKNTVFDQDPPAGERRPADSQVTIVVSSGPGKVELPDLRTFSEAAAREALRSQGLTVSDTKTVDDPDVDKGDVVRTSPAAHSTVEEGSAVVLEVSSGKVEVPDVVDKDWSEAKTVLADAGLRTATTFAPSDRPENTVLDQTHAGDKVAVGTVITLTVAQPVAAHADPDVHPRPPRRARPRPTPTQTPSSTPTGTPSTTPTGIPDDVGSHQDHDAVTGVHPGGTGVDVDLARDWVSSQVSALGGELTDAGTAHGDRAWSHTAVFGTTLGRVWFKANAPGTAHEPRLHRLLARLVPDLLPALLAADEPRAWSLLADAGPDAADPAPAPTRSRPRGSGCCRATPRRSWPWPPTGTTSLSAGVPERSPATLPGQATAFVAELATLDGGPGRPRARTGARRWRRGCRHTVAGVPTWPPRASRTRSQHDDLHSANVCVDGDGVRIIDWGDASLGHPFGTMLATLNSLAHHAGLDPGPRSCCACATPTSSRSPRMPTAATSSTWSTAHGRRAGSPGRWPGARHSSTEPPEAHADVGLPRPRVARGDPARTDLALRPGPARARAGPPPAPSPGTSGASPRRPCGRPPRRRARAGSAPRRAPRRRSARRSTSQLASSR